MPTLEYRLPIANVLEWSPTYPSIIAVPLKISDNVLGYAKEFRSRARIPALTYLHPINNCTITRSSQPLVGFRGNRSIQDEKLVAAICDTTKPNTKPFRSAPATPSASRSTSDLTSDGEKADLPPPSTLEESFIDAETIEDEAIKSISDGTSQIEGGTLTPRIYGAQQRNIIVDARPTVNAIANRAQGMGSEDMEYYRCATKAYLGIDNIHVMRKSLLDVVEALKDSDITPLPPNREQLAKSGWLKHIANMLDGAALIARTVGIYHSHVLVHCSDGWDRTSQLSALGQLCLDPYYRTLEGFIVLVEKDWLSFGHMFRHRSGFLSSEKWFEIENERVGGNRSASNGTPTSSGGNNAFETGVNRLKGFFNQSNASHDEFSDEESDVTDSAAKRSSAKPQAEDKLVTKVKETSPVFHQFLDATFQLMYQHPTRFEFNERFLRRLLYHLYSCQYGTFLYDNEKDRVKAKARERTRSVWDYFLARKDQFLNEKYDPVVDDNVHGKERIIFPRKEEVRWWAEVFGRSDAEMNGPPPTISDAIREQRLEKEREIPVLTGVEGADEARGVGSVRKAPQSPPPEMSIVDSEKAAALSLSQSSTPKRSSTPTAGDKYGPLGPLGPLGALSQSAGEGFAPLAQGASEKLSAGLKAMGLGARSGTNSPGRAKSPRGSREKEREMMEVEMQ